jgi:hypothetical protein
METRTVYGHERDCVIAVNVVEDDGDFVKLGDIVGVGVIELEMVGLHE